DAADRLHVAVLVDRARDRDILPQRQPRQRREECVKLRRGGGIAVYLVVGLLERDRRLQRKRQLLRVLPGEVAGENKEAFGVDPPRQLDLTLDRLDGATAERNASRNARGDPEAVVAEIGHAERVHLADPLALEVDRERPLIDQLLHPLLGQA